MGPILTSTLQAPLLGITFDTELNFRPHVLSIINKAVFQLQTLRRLCGLLDTNSKLTTLKAFIRSNFTYCCHIWYFTLSTLKDRLERLQYRGLKYVYNDYNSDYEILLKRANLDSVDLLIQKVILVDIYKAVNNIGAVYLQDLFQFSQNNTRRKDRDLVLPRVDSVTYGIHSLRYHGPKLWAAMPREAKTAPHDRPRRNPKKFNARWRDVIDATSKHTKMAAPMKVKAGGARAEENRLSVMIWYVLHQFNI